MNIINRSGGDMPSTYVNNFRAYAGNGEVVLELSQVDLVATISESVEGGEPESAIVDIKGRYVMRPDQVSQLINTLVTAISGPNRKECNQ